MAGHVSGTKGRGGMPDAWYESRAFLTDILRDSVARRIARNLILTAANADPADPDTWRRVAGEYDIATCPVPAHMQADFYGRLTFEAGSNVWLIAYNAACKPITQARILVHELAHWLQRHLSPWVLAGVEAVYYFAWGIEAAYHDIARRVERIVLGVAA